MNRKASKTHVTMGSAETDLTRIESFTMVRCRHHELD
jgi:hypothetical protein